MPEIGLSEIVFKSVFTRHSSGRLLLYIDSNFLWRVELKTIRPDAFALGLIVLSSF